MNQCAPEISIVIPAYKSAHSLPILLQRLDRTLVHYGRAHEIVVVDDGSPDDTWHILKTLKPKHPSLKIIRLLRNGGQHNALICGFNIAKGSIVVTMDDDLQNRPEDIPRLVDTLEQGYDLVIASYETKEHSAARNAGGRLVDAVQRHIFGLPRGFQLTSFRAIRKVVVDQVVKMGGVYPYVTSMLLCHTSKYANVPVVHESRKFGQSNYSTKKSLILALNLLLNYSSYPLFLVIALCIMALLVSVALGGWVIFKALFGGATVPGWASTIAGISFFNALILLALVIQGLYLSRMSQQLTRSRSSFAIGEVHE